MKKYNISYNAPAVLTFTFISLIVTILGIFSNEKIVSEYFSLYHSSLNNPWTYVRMITNAFGYHSLYGLISDSAFILLLGPILEEKIGTKKIIVVMLLSTIISSIIFYFYMPSIVVCGADSIVFAFILLCSFTSCKKGSIPLTMILVLVLYIGNDIYQSIFVSHNLISIIYIIGGAVGSFMGYKFKRI